MPRFTVIVLDSFGVGALPDAARFGDEGAFTLGHIREQIPDLRLPNMVSLGLYNIDGLGLPGVACPVGCYGKCAEVSAGKDTTTGHYEIAGLLVEQPGKVYPFFPPRITEELEKRIGRKFLGNRAASGTAIIRELGDEHVRTGCPILYTSADSVMQIAMHEAVIPLEEQYKICRAARGLMMGENAVDRIICRPFTGESGHYTRTENRRDYALDPPGPTILDHLKENGRDVIAVGKIEDIFNRRGITKAEHTGNNEQGIGATVRLLSEPFDGLLLVNLVDFDMLYGHRNDPHGYARALERFDEQLPAIVSQLRADDILVLTADHGCDPTAPGTDHTREYVPLLVCGPSCERGINLGVRATFSDISATCADFFGLRPLRGTSFLGEILPDRFSKVLISP